MKLLTSAWPSPDHHSHLRSEPADKSFSHSPCVSVLQINKVNLREKEKELSFAASLPKWQQCPGLSQSPEPDLQACLSMGTTVPNTQAIIFWLPWNIRRELGQKLEQKQSIWTWTGIASIARGTVNPLHPSAGPYTSFLRSWKLRQNVYFLHSSLKFLSFSWAGFEMCAGAPRRRVNCFKNLCFKRSYSFGETKIPYLQTSLQDCLGVGLVVANNLRAILWELVAVAGSWTLGLACLMRESAFCLSLCLRNSCLAQQHICTHQRRWVKSPELSEPCKWLQGICISEC